MMRMQYEQEALRRELELQRYKKAEPAPLNKYDVKPRHVASRERERNALNLLDAYEKQLVAILLVKLLLNILPSSRILRPEILSMRFTRKNLASLT